MEKPSFNTRRKLASFDITLCGHFLGEAEIYQKEDYTTIVYLNTENSSYCTAGTRPQDRDKFVIRFQSISDLFIFVNEVVSLTETCNYTSIAMGRTDVVSTRLTYDEYCKELNSYFIDDCNTID